MWRRISRFIAYAGAALLLSVVVMEVRRVTSERRSLDDLFHMYPQATVGYGDSFSVAGSVPAVYLYEFRRWLGIRPVYRIALEGLHAGETIDVDVLLAFPTLRQLALSERRPLEMDSSHKLDISPIGRLRRIEVLEIDATATNVASLSTCRSLRRIALEYGVENVFELAKRPPPRLREVFVHASREYAAALQREFIDCNVMYAPLE